MKKKLLTLGFLSLLILGIHAQENTGFLKITEKGKNAFVKLKDGVNPDVYIDGKKYDSSILDLLDTEKIDAITVYKGKPAIEKFKVENVIVITTKKKKAEEEEHSNNENITVKSDRIYVASDVQIKGNEEYPVIVIDGAISNKEDLRIISPDDIEAIQILKDEESKKKYNTETGVILVTTKTAKKEAESQKKK